MLPAQLRAATPYHESTKPPPPYDVDAMRRFGALRKLGREPDAKDPRVIREAATLLTSQLFFAPLLAEMRKLPFGKQLGHGGRMEEVFGEQLDLRIADTVARADRGFTEQLAERLARRPRAESATGPTTQRASWPAQLQARQAIGREKE